MKILVACEESQEVTKAFRAKGHEAYSCDLQDCSGGHPEWHLKCDVLSVLSNGWDLMIAHPDCTRLTNAGVRWLHTGTRDKTVEELWKELDESAKFYCLLRDADIEKKCIENPVMHPYAYNLIGKPDRQIVQPWWFGDKAFKATGFELIGLPPLVATNKLVPPKKGTEDHKAWSWVHREPPGPNRKKNRSKTFPGIASAIAEQWG